MIYFLKDKMIVSGKNKIVKNVIKKKIFSQLIISQSKKE